MATKKADTAVAAKPEPKGEENALTIIADHVPDFLKNQGGEGRGSEQVTADDLVIPRLEVVQSLSPCRKRNDPAYIEGAEEGMLYNNVTRELYGTEVMVVPVFFRMEWVIFKDRNKGGGFRGAFSNDLEAKAALRELVDGDGKSESDDCEVVDMAQHFCLLLNPKTNKIEEIVISMAKTKMKVSRKWNSVIRLNGGDRFSRVYKVAGVSETNSKNQDFFNLNISQVGFVNALLYKKAEELYNSIKSGAVQINRDTVDEGEPGGGSTEY